MYNIYIYIHIQYYYYYHYYYYYKYIYIYIYIYIIQYILQKILGLNGLSGGLSWRSIAFQSSQAPAQGH